MKTVGIIAEYNPFHNGHLYQLNKARECTGADYAVIVMSGDYTQRGQPTIYAKSMRARCALLSGADLVIEMPVFGSVASAADFAECGVSLLNEMGIVDTLCFGSECGDPDLLMNRAALLSEETPEISLLIKKYLKAGLTWPKAREQAYQAFYADFSIHSPNDILAVEYIRALKKLRSPIRPAAIRRIGPGYHSLQNDGSFASATAVRAAILNGDTAFQQSALPASFWTSRAVEYSTEIGFDDFSLLLNQKLLSMTPDAVRLVSQMPESLARKLYRERLHFLSASGRAAASKARQYTYTRVCRCLMNVILSITKDDTEQFKAFRSAPWIRVLGFRRSAAPLLSLLNQNARVPVITKTAAAGKTLSGARAALFEKHLQASELYRMIGEAKCSGHCLHNTPQNTAGQTGKNEFTRPLIII